MSVSHITVLNIILMFTALVSNIDAAFLPQEFNEGVCEQTVTRIVSHIVYVQKKRQECPQTRTNCRTIYCTVSETRYKTKTENVHVCCHGFVEVDGVCKRVDITTAAMAGDTNGLNAESDEMSTAMIVGLGSVIVISIIAMVLLVVICMHRRKPKLTFLKKLKRNSSADNNYTDDGYLEPRTSKRSLSAIGNALYKKGLFSTKKESKRESNIYTDLRTQTYANKPDSESHDYTMLDESVKPPINKLTSYFESKKDDSPPTKAKLPQNRANTSPVRKQINQHQQRINSTPLPKTKVKQTTNTHSTSLPKVRVKNENSFATKRSGPNDYQQKAGVHSLINSFTAKSEQQNVPKSPSKPGSNSSVSSNFKVNKPPTKQHNIQTFPTKRNAGINLSRNPKTIGNGKELHSPLLSKNDARSILMRTLEPKTATLRTPTDDPPEYEDINFYEEV